MPDDLTTLAAKLLWAKIPYPQACPDEIDEAAAAVVKLVLDEALDVKRPNMSRIYCTNDEAFFNEGFDAAMSAIRALGDDNE